VIEKLHELESVGVDQFNIYLMTGQQEATLEAYGKDIIPMFAGRGASHESAHADPRPLGT
jgi:hypothetical protein